MMKSGGVLILILLEYGLQLDNPNFREILDTVLILILLEYGLQLKKNPKTGKLFVLILILLEYGLQHHMWGLW